jgi:predicted ferric reductase
MIETKNKILILLILPSVLLLIASAIIIALYSILGNVTAVATSLSCLVVGAIILFTVVAITVVSKCRVKKPASSTKRHGKSSVAVEHCQITCELSKELQPGYFPIQDISPSEEYFNYT